MTEKPSKSKKSHEVNENKQQQTTNKRTQINLSKKNQPNNGNINKKKTPKTTANPLTSNLAPET
jgi:hypothetical protein